MVFLVLWYLGCVMIKLVFEDVWQCKISPAQLQKLARVLKLLVYQLQVWFYLGSKDSDQTAWLCRLICIFVIWKWQLPIFSWHVWIFLMIHQLSEFITPANSWINSCLSKPEKLRVNIWSVRPSNFALQYLKHVTWDGLSKPEKLRVNIWSVHSSNFASQYLKHVTWDGLSQDVKTI